MIGFIETIKVCFQIWNCCLEWGDRIPLGLFYRSEQPIYEESEPVLKRGPLVKQSLGLTQSLLDELLAETM